jgi:hypothetical protein
MTGSFMRHSARIFMACGAIATPLALAAESPAQEVGREIGAILAWRIGPELVEEKCRTVDPAGVEAREKALKTWRDKNAALIVTVDERLADIIPLAYPLPDPAQAVAAVRAQVREILLETISAEGDETKLEAACKEDANPASTRWSSNGVSQVHNSLAALYDWKTQKQKK